MGRASRPGNGRDIVHRLAAPPSKPPALLRPPHPHHDLAQPPALLDVGKRDGIDVVIAEYCFVTKE